jgi:ferredoxin-thioredoxin reductase catalytic subunit
MEKIVVKDSSVDETHKKLDEEAEESGYHLNPDKDFAKQLVRSLLINQQRYGYWACPCRLAKGVKGEDIDIICPCDYRDADINQFGMCFCALYVSTDVAQGKKKVGSIPERRPTEKERKRMMEESASMMAMKSDLKLPVWRCKVCGYLCARNEPPEICPICKVTKDRFERFM